MIVLIIKVSQCNMVTKYNISQYEVGIKLFGSIITPFRGQIRFSIDNILQTVHGQNS